MSLIQMSVSGAVMILVIVVFRALLLHKLPKRAFPVLWGVVLVRLLIPYTLPCSFSVYSLLSGIGAEISATAPPADNPSPPPVTNFVPDNAAPFVPDLSPGNTVAPTPTPELPPENGLPFDIGTAVWITGMTACAVFFTVSYVKCRMKFRESLPVESPRIAQWLGEHRLRRRISVRRSDRIAAPLTYGILRPVILLPKNYEKIDSDDLGFVLTHEYVHIRRFDAVFKILLTAAVCVHWFNPLVWVMYIIANKDIEISCDEAVIAALSEREKKSYAMTLIRMEEVKSGFTPLINSFGKNAIKERIVSIMKFKKTTVLTAAAAAFLAVGITTAFATSAKSPDKAPDSTGDTVSAPVSDTVSTPASSAAAENDSVEATPAKTIKPTDTIIKYTTDYYLEKYADHVTTTDPGVNCLVLPHLDENGNLVLNYIPIEVMSENEVSHAPNICYTNIAENWLKQCHNSPLANMNVELNLKFNYCFCPAALDTEVLAIEDGEVVYAEKGFNQGWGSVVVLKHNGGIYTIYGHLETDHGIKVNVGDTVKAGQCIGYVGKSGKADGYGLGFGCKDKMPDLKDRQTTSEPVPAESAPAESSDDHDYMIPIEGGFLYGKYHTTGVIPDVETKIVEKSTLNYYLNKYADHVTTTPPEGKHMALPYYDENGKLVIYYIPMECISNMEFLAKTENCPNYQIGETLCQDSSCPIHGCANGDSCQDSNCPTHGYNYSQQSGAHHSENHHSENHHYKYYRF